MEKHKTELSLNKNFTFSTKFGISSPTFAGFFVCGMMENFKYPALFGTRDISFNIKLTTKVVLCGESL